MGGLSNSGSRTVKVGVIPYSYRKSLNPHTKGVKSLLVHPVIVHGLSRRFFVGFVILNILCSICSLRP